MGSGDTTVFDVQTVGGLFEHASELCMLIDEAFSGKKQNFWSCDFCT
jgi:hypothetical protein